MATTMIKPSSSTLSAEPMQNNGAKAQGPALIRLHKLSKSFVEGGTTRTVLDELNTEFQEGEFICLLGKSGSGKSTLINLIAGLDSPSNGEVIINHQG